MHENVSRANSEPLIQRQTAILCRILPAFFTVLFVATHVAAEPLTLQTTEDPLEISTFSLNFGEYGGVSSAMIARTDYELQMDTVMGTARFASYYQEVEPLTLPGGASTGNIVVEVVEGSSTGTYDLRSGVFSTNELYAVHFDGDLSMFGLTSPVLLPGASTGFVALDAQSGGTITMEWAGEGALANPFDPQSLINFTYTCRVNTVFAAEPNLLLRLAMVPEVLNLELPIQLEDQLVNKLELAAAEIDRNNPFGAIGTLRSFIRQVGRSPQISDEGADVLIAGAQDIIALLRPTRAGASLNRKQHRN